MSPIAASDRDRNDLQRFISAPTRFLVDRPADPLGTILLAHGAGAPMDSAWMNTLTCALLGVGLRVIRFEFAYMAARREGSRRPPPKAESLVAEYAPLVRGSLETLEGPCLIGGKSLGGRVATMVAGEIADPRLTGVVAFGYPFHPPAKPDQTRLGPLSASRAPVLIHQGERDPFGHAAEVAAYPLPDHVRLAWYADGDHDLAPRKASGLDLDGHLKEAARATAAFLRA